MISRRLRTVRRLLWRWEWGWSRAAEVEDALRGQLGRLSSERNLTVGWRHRLRELPEASYRDQEAALDDALRSLRSLRYREAFEHLCAAEALVRRLNRATSTYEDLQRSRTVWRQTVARLRLEPFSELFTLSVVPRLQRETEELLDAGEERKAGFVLGVATETLAVLDSVDADTGWSERLTSRLQGIEPGPPVDARLRDLLADGRHKLVESLLLDLEIRGDGRARTSRLADGEIASSLAVTAQRADVLAARLGRLVS